MEERIPLWLDCDPGHDDAFAILVAAHHESLHLLGVSTVHGNASLERTTASAGSILTAIGKHDVPVYPGAAKPFCRKAVHAPDIHGVTGIDGTDLLPKATAPPIKDGNAVMAMRMALLAQPEGTAWLVATGALTNAALLFATFPKVAKHIKGLSIMGGAIGGGFSDALISHVRGEGERIGNITSWAEFNIYCDPEAAQAIFANEILAAKTTLITLDLTHQVLATDEIREQLLRGTLQDDNPLAASLTLRIMLHDLLSFFASTYADVFGLISGPPLHDPIAVAVLLIDVLYEPLEFDDGAGERWHVNVVTEGLHSDRSDERGQLGRIRARKAETNESGVRIPRGVNVKHFWALIERCVQSAEILLAAQQYAS